MYARSTGSCAWICTSKMAAPSDKSCRGRTPCSDPGNPRAPRADWLPWLLGKRSTQACWPGKRAPWVCACGLRTTLLSVGWTMPIGFGQRTSWPVASMRFCCVASGMRAPKLCSSGRPRLAAMRFFVWEFRWTQALRSRDLIWSFHRIGVDGSRGSRSTPWGVVPSPMVSRALNWCAAVTGTGPMRSAWTRDCSAPVAI